MTAPIKSRVQASVVKSLLVLCVFTLSSYGQNLNQAADTMLYSGEVIWNVTFDVLRAIEAPTENRILNMPDEVFNQWKQKLSQPRSQNYTMQAIFQGDKWKQKLSQPRSQNYTMQAIFQGDNLYIHYTSAGGDVFPLPMDETVAYNRTSIYIVNHSNRVYLRSPASTAFRETSLACFYISPRACGFGYGEIMSMAKKVKDIQGTLPSISQEENETSGRLIMRGTYPTGTITLADLQPDSEYRQAYARIVYINPAFGERVKIENSNFAAYSDGTVYPGTTVIERFSQGTLEDLPASALVDRITLTVQSAQFNSSYPDEMFNPSCPEGYEDIADYRKQQRDSTLN